VKPLLGNESTHPLIAPTTLVGNLFTNTGSSEHDESLTPIGVTLGVAVALMTEAPPATEDDVAELLPPLPPPTVGEELAEPLGLVDPEVDDGAAVGAAVGAAGAIIIVAEYDTVGMDVGEVVCD